MSNDKEINRLKELLRRRDKVILQQAQEIAELKQKLLLHNQPNVVQTRNPTLLRLT
jgi:hypothetical protein